jgi:hypothetical protein
MLKSFTPVPLQIAQTSALRAWFDASVPESIVSSSGRVSAWRDLSGNKRNAVQATGLRQPSTGVDTIAGKNVISFDTATAQNIRFPDAAFPDLINGSVTFFLVGLAGSTQIANPSFLFGVSTPDRFYVQIEQTTNYLQFRFGPGTALAFLTTFDASAAPFVVMMSVNGSTDLCTATINNGTPDTGTKAYTGPILTPGFGSFASNVNPANGVVAESLIFDGILSDEHMQSMWEYLGEKWGVAV